MSDREVVHLLILGGTAEAAALAAAADKRFGAALKITTSLAGITRAPRPVPGALRVGGFGGASGLAIWLKSNEVDLVVDATHPFAINISKNTIQACDSIKLPRLVFSRPSWESKPGDRWRIVSDLDSAAALLPEMAERVFLSVGSQRLEAFADLQGVHLLVRMIDPPETPPPLIDYTVVLGRGPFGVEAEHDLLRRERIDTIVSRNSGGVATYAKIEAARHLHLPVLMVAPPARETDDKVESLEGALRWVEAQIAMLSVAGL